jgi:hypothetical protein
VELENEEDFERFRNLNVIFGQVCVDFFNEHGMSYKGGMMCLASTLVAIMKKNKMTDQEIKEHMFLFIKSAMDMPL